MDFSNRRSKIFNPLTAFGLFRVKPMTKSLKRGLSTNKNEFSDAAERRSLTADVIKTKRVFDEIIVSVTIIFPEKYFICRTSSFLIFFLYLQVVIQKGYRELHQDAIVKLFLRLLACVSAVYPTEDRRLPVKILLYCVLHCCVQLHNVAWVGDRQIFISTSPDRTKDRKLVVCTKLKRVGAHMKICVKSVYSSPVSLTRLSYEEIFLYDYVYIDETIADIKFRDLVRHTINQLDI